MGDSEYTVKWVQRYPAHATMTFESQIKSDIETWTSCSGWRVVTVAFMDADTLMVMLVR